MYEAADHDSKFQATVIISPSWYTVQLYFSLSLHPMSMQQVNENSPHCATKLQDVEADNKLTFN